MARRKEVPTKTGPRREPAGAAAKTGQKKGAARGARPTSLKTVGKSTAAKKGARSKVAKKTR